jgi:hypothetical protein
MEKVKIEIVGPEKEFLKLLFKTDDPTTNDEVELEKGMVAKLKGVESEMSADPDSLQYLFDILVSLAVGKTIENVVDMMGQMGVTKELKRIGALLFINGTKIHL